MEKKSKETEDLLKMLTGVRGKGRELMPRPTVFKDKKKYDRKRDKKTVMVKEVNDE